MRKFFLGIILFFSVSLVFAFPQPLPAERAFALTSYIDEHEHIVFQWNMAPGYYLYQNKLNFSISPTTHIQIGKVTWPGSESKIMSTGENVSIYAGSLKLAVPLEGALKGPITLTVSYQGCSMSGFCYAPIKKYYRIDLSTIKPLQNLTPEVMATAQTQPFISDHVLAEKIFVGHSFIFIILSFLGLGLLLAFTPCVLPMIPILSGIIVGHKKKVSTFYAFTLSLNYVLGMAITYAIAGMIVASLGSSIQVLFQKPAIIILFSGLFVLLSLSLFGFYELQLPARWQHKTTHLSNKLKGGSHLGVFLMGCLSTLIVSPCVSAPLVGVLAYIAQTGDKFLGAVALLMLGIGMGIPLLLIGTSAGKWLPKAGHWMELIKKLFGVLMLGVAIWMLSRILSGSAALFLWSLLFIGTGIYFGVCYYRIWLRIAGSLVLLYGVILFVGAALGNSSPFYPWETVDLNGEKNYFTVVNTQSELDQQLQLAKQQHKPVVLDFYAKWCVSCVDMDKHLFSRKTVQNIFSDFVRLRIDVTENDSTDREIMKHYHVVAPPTMIFFNAKGLELDSQRVVGEVNEAQLLKIKEQQRAK